LHEADNRRNACPEEAKIENAQACPPEIKMVRSKAAKQQRQQHAHDLVTPHGLILLLKKNLWIDLGTELRIGKRCCGAHKLPPGQTNRELQYRKSQLVTTLY